MTAAVFDVPRRRLFGLSRQYWLPALALAIVLALVLVPLGTLVVFSFRIGAP